MSATDCTTCNGTGWVPLPGRVPDDTGMYDRYCPTCGGDGIGGESHWKQGNTWISQRGRDPISVSGWLSPSGRWHVRRARPGADTWQVTHIPTTDCAMSLIGLLRDIKRALDDLDAEIGLVTLDEYDRETAREMIAPHAPGLVGRFSA